jgi:HEAT repeat protein
MTDVERAADVAAIGLAGRAGEAEVARLTQLVFSDPSARVRSAALGALARVARRADAAHAWHAASIDADASVRRRAAELAPTLGRNVREPALLALLADDEPTVAEAAAFALGERKSSTRRALDALIDAATTHDDPLVREQAVASLGARGDQRGLPAILHACHDRPAIRRRAVLALAAFEGDEVDAALHAALGDNDWQVRQAAEDLLSP